MKLDEKSGVYYLSVPHYDHVEETYVYSTYTYSTWRLVVHVLFNKKFRYNLYTTLLYALRWHKEVGGVGSYGVGLCEEKLHMSKVLVKKQ